MKRTHTHSQKAPKRLAVLGTGKMGGILIDAFVKQSLLAPNHIFATVHCRRDSCLRQAADRWAGPRRNSP